MNIIGIVSEFNPFHNGHQYLIEQSRKALGRDAVVICVMSGDYVQRGEAALFSKYARAEAACRCGADLLVELPLPWCISSAERFASAAVDILSGLACTHIAFGSECGDIASLTKTADALLDGSVREAILSAMREDESLSYARARYNVIRSLLGEEAELIRQPNNILAVEYIKAIRSKHPELEAFTVQRIGSGHDEYGNEGPKSASELRDMISRGQNTEGCIPDAAMNIYKEEERRGRKRNEALFETAVLSRLRMFDPEYFDTLPDASGGIGRKLYKAIHSRSGLEEIVDAVADKKNTRARVRRMILCAAFQIRADYTNAPPPYARLLAMTYSGKNYLNHSGEHFTVPLITKPASVKKLDKYSVRVFGIGADGHDMLTAQFVTKDDRLPGEDWRKGPIIV